VRVEIKNGWVYFYDSYNQKDDIKTILGREWMKELKAWRIPYRPEIVAEANAVLQLDIPSPVVKKPKYKPIAKTLIPYLYAHQKLSLGYFKNKNCTADLSEPGTGKTLVTIEMMLKRCAWPVLIICPKSIMEEVWVNQINEVTAETPSFKNIRIAVLNKGSDNIRRILQEYEKTSYLIYIINYESVPNVINYLKGLPWKFIVLDESTKIKNHKANRSKAIMALRDYAKFRHIMTGTLAPNGLMDAFNQIRFVDNTLFGESYYAMRQHYFTQDPFNQYNWIPKSEAIEMFKKNIEEVSIQHKKRECIDLPPLVEVKRPVTLGSEEMDKYTDMKEEALIEVGNETIIAPWKITAIMKMRQICSGFVYGNDEAYHEIGHSKFDILEEIIEQIDGKVIIFSHFNYSLRRLYEKLSLKFYKAVVYMGKDTDKKMALSLFKNSANTHILLANPASAGHGLNLQYCSNIIYYELDFNLENYLQSIDRINRIGQQNKMTVYYTIAQNTIESWIYRKLKNKEKLNQKISIADFKKIL